MTVAGYLWGLGYPVSKPLWTGSYVVFMAGLTILLLAIINWLQRYPGLRKLGVSVRGRRCQCVVFLRVCTVLSAAAGVRENHPCGRNYNPVPTLHLSALDRAVAGRESRRADICADLPDALLPGCRVTVSAKDLHQAVVDEGRRLELPVKKFGVAADRRDRTECYYRHGEHPDDRYVPANALAEEVRLF